ncbi:MAG: ABC transporter permease [Thermoanaerobaculia bacterium]|nr:ABC transporter permease [Thermoanaerobaculia bacterium]
MLFLENFRIALRALWANKMRSLLTTLGIIIGVAAVIAVVSIVQGLQFQITQQLQGAGATYIVIVPDLGNQGPGVVARQVKLTWEDGEAILRRVPGVAQITPVVLGNAEAKYRDRQHRTLVLGVNQAWPDVVDFQVEKGRFLSAIDLDHRRKVAVVGLRVVEELRLGSDPVGKEIYVGNIPVTVIGLMEKKGRFLGTDVDDMLYLPFETSLNLFGRSAADQVQLRLKAESAEIVERVRDDITTLLRQRHRIAEDQPDDFQVFLQDEMLSTVNSILGSVTAVVGAVVGVALLVGGIGIMNIMLVSVTERTREIGIRKSVGARRRDILIQFLIEAVTLSLLGGAIGLSVGWGIGVVVANLLPGSWPTAHVPLWAVAVAFGFSSLVGVFFGIYPAGKAARLDPIEALRYE